MDSPFFRNRYMYPQPDPSRSRPKVVQIPVHFVGSEPQDRSTAVKIRKSYEPPVDRSLAAALKIQKVARGFLVRKSMKKIKDVKKQVDEIERKLRSEQVVQLIRRDQKERLRLSEGLMSLLLKLDSIRGFDLGVKDCRKAVIKKAIALQEKIDAIVSIDDVVKQEANTNCEEEMEMVDCNENLDVDVVKTVEEEANNRCEEEMVDCDENLGDVLDKDSVEESDGIMDVGVDCETKIMEVENRNDKSEERELLEKMMEENGKMMKMMNELVNRNDNQMKMLSALTHRVELLEKAFLCDRLRRKKNKKMNKNKLPNSGEE